VLISSLIRRKKLKRGIIAHTHMPPPPPTKWSDNRNPLLFFKELKLRKAKVTTGSKT
jgi:hypothetical protein